MEELEITNKTRTFILDTMKGLSSFEIKYAYTKENERKKGYLKEGLKKLIKIAKSKRIKKIVIYNVQSLDPKIPTSTIEQIYIKSGFKEIHGTLTINI